MSILHGTLPSIEEDRRRAAVQRLAPIASDHSVAAVAKTGVALTSPIEDDDVIGRPVEFG